MIIEKDGETINLKETLLCDYHKNMMNNLKEAEIKEFDFGSIKQLKGDKKLLNKVFEEILIKNIVR